MRAQKLPPIPLNGAAHVTQGVHFSWIGAGHGDRSEAIHLAEFVGR
jgi:hypothetical protein